MVNVEKIYGSGVICLHSSGDDVDQLMNLLQKRSDSEKFDFALVYFSGTSWDVDSVYSLMSVHATNMRYAACSTAGELTPSGMTEGDLVITLFPKECFQVDAYELADEGGDDMQNMVSQIISHKNRFFTKEDQGISPLVICLMDGLSNHEETMAAALHWGLGDIPVLGGSSGDDLQFKRTSLVLDGVSVEGSAIILMIKSKLPFQVFKTDNFVPTDEKLVVTKSEPEVRTVHEFNGLPAAETYSKTINLDSHDLIPQSFASHPLVVKVGGEYFCRSIQKVNEDGSMAFFCAIDDGIVLTVAEPRGMVESTRKKLSEIEKSIGGIDFILGFDCVLRKIDAGNRQITRSISDIYQEYNVIGFNTYGEQYRSMHLNQTLTGVAFGPPDKS